MLVRCVHCLGSRNDVATQEQAITYFQHAATISPAYSRAYYNWALALEALGKWDEALRMFNSVLRVEAASVHTTLEGQSCVSGALLGIGNVEYRMGRANDATHTYRCAEQTAPLPCSFPQLLYCSFSSLLQRILPATN